MNFFAVVGRRTAADMKTLDLDRHAQQQLTDTFTSLAAAVVEADHVSFEPSYRADEGEIVTIQNYQLPSAFVPLQSAAAAHELEPLKGEDIEQADIQGIVGVEWQGRTAHMMVLQKTDARYVLRRERLRLMIADGRFVQDVRPGLEIAQRADALVDFPTDTLHVVSWPRAHALLNLSEYMREATLSEVEEFVSHRKLVVAEGFDIATIADTVVRRKIASIQERDVLGKCSVAKLKDYAAKFKVQLKVSQGKIVIPANKQEFKSVLDLLDENLLEFEPTNERWVVNSKRRVTAK